MNRALANLSQLLPATVGVCLALTIPTSAEDSAPESGKQAGEAKRGYTKVLQIYDPGLQLSKKKRKKDKGVEQAAQRDWRDMLTVPHEPLPAQAPRAPMRSRSDEDEDDDEDDWLLHITDPDGKNRDEEESQDPWEDDVLSDPYKHVFGHDVEDAIEQMAEPVDSDEDLDSDEETLEDEEELARDDREDDNEGRDTTVYEPVLSESYDQDESDRTLESSSLDAEELARERLERRDRGDPMEEEKEDTVLTETWATLHGSGEKSLGSQSSSDGLLSQTRSQLNAMGKGFSVFRDSEDAALDSKAAEESFFSEKTGRDRDNLTTRFGGYEPFADRSFAGDSRLDSTFDNSVATYGASGESFGETSMNLRDEPSFTFNDSFSGTKNNTMRGASATEVWGNTTPADEIRNQGPKDRFGQSDPFGSQSDRFKFLD